MDGQSRKYTQIKVVNSKMESLLLGVQSKALNKHSLTLEVLKKTVVERANGTLGVKTRALLQATGLPELL